jgi:glucosamine-6-phosphate deaminase
MYQVFDTVDEVSRYTAQRILDKIKATPDAILGFATGSTMEPVYARLLQCLQQAPVDVPQSTTFNLDEYIGLGAEHSQSYNYYMCQHLFNQLNIPVQSVNLPDGFAKDVKGACQAYSDAIKAVGGFDLQLLGIGSNGHNGL